MRTWTGAAAALLFATAARGQEAEKASAYAAQAVRELTGQVLTGEGATRLGFKSLDEAREARPGAPMKVLVIGLAGLRKYPAGAGLRSVAAETGALWFPVLVGLEVRGKLEIYRKPGGAWATGEFGRARLAAEVARAVGAVARAPDAPPVEVVRVPALNLLLVRAIGPQGEVLVPAVGGFGLEAGTAYPVDEALRKLAVAAIAADDRQVR